MLQVSALTRHFCQTGLVGALGVWKTTVFYWVRNCNDSFFIEGIPGFQFRHPNDYAA